MLAGVNKIWSRTPAPHPDIHPPPSMSPNTFPPSTTSHLSIFPAFLSPSSPSPSLSLCTLTGGALLLLPGTGREGQALTSPLPPAIISLICTPSVPLLLLLPPSLFLPLTYSNWSRVEWVRRGEGGTHARRWTFDPSTPWTLCCRLLVNLAWTSSRAVLVIITLDSSCPLRFASGRKTKGNKRERNTDSSLC